MTSLFYLYSNVPLKIQRAIKISHRGPFDSAQGGHREHREINIKTLTWCFDSEKYKLESAL
jgi:hypothetical protein